MPVLKVDVVTAEERLYEGTAKFVVIPGTEGELGILPVQSFKQVSNVAGRCGASVPSWFAEKFEGLDDDPEARKLVAATVAAGQVQKLFKHGVDTFHFYTMNRADLVFAISHLLGFRASTAQKAA